MKIILAIFCIFYILTSYSQEGHYKNKKGNNSVYIYAGDSIMFASSRSPAMLGATYTKNCNEIHVHFKENDIKNWNLKIERSKLETILIKNKRVIIVNGEKFKKR